MAGTIKSIIASRPVLVGVIIVFVVVLLAVFFAGQGDIDAPTAEVSSGTFVVSLIETGELNATKSVAVSAPRVGDRSTRPQIVKLVPEGSTVRKGDFIAQFDVSALDKTIEQKEAELEIAQADLSRAQAANEALIEDLEASLANVRAAYELAELQLKQMEFEAEVRKREQELQLERSRNDLKRAEANLRSQHIIIAEDERKLQLRINQAKAELNKAIQDKESLTLVAPMNGLVVYPKVWSGGTTPQKIQEGDTPWPGQVIIELPDLSEMEVITDVTEVDVAKVDSGQRVEVRLDAFPDSVFSGVITSVATLAKVKDDDNPIKVFEVSVLLNRTSSILRPGMTASTKIIIAEYPDSRWIPLDAIFTEDDTTVVYEVRGNRSIKTTVAIGEKNENNAILKSGPEAGTRLLLLNPNAEIEQSTTSPSSASDAQAPSRASRGGHVGRVRG